jgi:hypothetical protein
MDCELAVKIQENSTVEQWMLTVNWWAPPTVFEMVASGTCDLASGWPFVKDKYLADA